MEFQVNTHLNRVASLCKILTSGSVQRCKGVVAGICEVSSPQAKCHETEVCISMCANYAIELLKECICLVPVCLALRIGIRANGYGTQSTV